VAKAMDYVLKRWLAFTRFLENGQIDHQQRHGAGPERDRARA